MKSLKNIALSFLLSVGAFTAVTYTACTKDACKDVVCQNGGTCSSGVCVCPTGYEGTNCETLTVSYFAGTWTGSDACNSGTYSITLTIAASSTSVNAIISNPGGFGSAVTITGIVTGTNTLTFTNQSVGGGRTLTGSMTFNSSSTTMSFSYTVTPATGAADVCNGSYTKQ